MGIIKEKVTQINLTDAFMQISKKKKLSTGLEYFLKAETLRNSELYNEAVRFYLSSILIENNNFKCYFGLAMAYKHIHEYEKAIKTLNKAKKIDKHSYKLHYELGVLYLLCENPCAAIKEFQKAIMIDKKNYDAQLQLAKAHEVIGENDMAELIYNRILELSPTNVAAYNCKANLYMNEKMFFEAGAIYTQLLKINPNFHQAYFALGVCFEKLGKVTDSIRYFRKFAELNPNSINTPEIKKHLQKLKSQLGDRISNIKLVK